MKFSLQVGKQMSTIQSSQSQDPRDLRLTFPFLGIILFSVSVSYDLHTAVQVHMALIYPLRLDHATLGPRCTNQYLVTYRDTGSFNSFSPTSYLDVIVPGQKFGKLIHSQTIEKHASAFSQTKIRTVSEL
jgi:hypothetical protein